VEEQQEIGVVEAGTTQKAALKTAFMYTHLSDMNINRDEKVKSNYLD
jgi:hypothetical protein